MEQDLLRERDRARHSQKPGPCPHAMLRLITTVEWWMSPQ